MDEQEYLQPDFDPASLTMPRLRGILVAHSVKYPASAKKGQLVDLFNADVLPHARTLRSANARVKRTSRGIENVPSSQSTVNGDEEDEDDDGEPELRPPPSRTSRRTTRARLEDGIDVAPTPRRSRMSAAVPEATPRRSSIKHARTTEALETETEPEAKRPASRPSAAVGAGESPFSAQNVFQSGSSPPAPHSRDPERRRTTMTPAQDNERHRSREARRRTAEVRPVREQMDGAVVPTRRTFDMPAARIRQEEVGVEVGEDFVPEEQQDLVQAQQSGPLVSSRPKAKRPASSAARTAPWAVSIAMLLGFATVWRQEKVEVGYCGVGRPTTELAGVAIPDWAQFMRPQCEPCPPHAYCGERLETVCEQDFVLIPHPLSLGGAVPLPPSCEPDSLKAKRVSQVKERAAEVLREQNAKFECGDEPRAEVPESQLKQAIAAKRKKGMTSEEFEDLWTSALPEIHSMDEVVSGSDSSGRYVLRSTSLARLPLACAIRRSLLETARRYLWQLVALLTLLSSTAYGRRTLTTGRATEAHAKRLAGLALDRLSAQASLHAFDPNAYPENYIAMAQLRDDVLRDEFSAKRRALLWRQVQKKVEQNANVRPLVREGRSGDVGRVWEWVGAVGLLESPPGTGDRRRSPGGAGGRASYGGDDIGAVTRVNGEKGMVGKKWEEGGAYY